MEAKNMWIIVAIIVAILIFMMFTKKKETFLSPAGYAPRQADLFEIAMRQNMYR